MGSHKQAKTVFETDSVIVKYTLAITEVGLWKSEQDLILKYFLNKQANLLDLGCGAGRSSFNLENLGYKNIYAIDISKKMIDTARLIQKQIHNSKIVFENMDASNLKYPNAHFNYAFFSFNGFSGIPKHQNRIKALNEIYRVLKPNGIFIFSIHPWNQQKYQQRLKKENISKTTEFEIERYGDLIFKNEENLYDFFHLYSDTELKQKLSSVGFRVLDIINRDTNYSEDQQVLSFADNTNFWICQK
ncbi:ubiquinone/menaquinone biosynthesis C-methylase UbiE [Mycoplasmopsis mustelae]|uniref:Ubiquinone/menaquinone biosynthesis C-methylase UbiE n=1 Tax=Mycoplasmopsis mustelae TaxID=171289 RepID=A0A4R7UCI8_9BACT|nr:methyltransferase domain-containing protein [Mycoplasmopsis mustelae]TDV24089.1 ubiquinone/menaquinone biosynthesis C-methylase UbiE [Mycoplasmopsis mustelae]